MQGLSGMRVRKRGFAKVNLGLWLTGTEGTPDAAMHTLKTLYCALPELYDTLDFEVTPGSGKAHYTADIKIAQNVPLPFDGDNLIYKVLGAAGVFDTLAQKALDLKIHLEKVIPLAGGLAGGSADAAATICALEDLGLLKGEPLSDDPLSLGREFTALGADINFAYFAARRLNDKTSPQPYVLAIGEHFGEVITPVDMSGTTEKQLRERLRVEIIESEHTVSAKECYSKYDELLKSGRITPSCPDDAWSNVMQLAEMLKGEAAFNAPLFNARLHNDLELPALALCPELGRKLREIKESSPFAFVFVSGSGPSIVSFKYRQN
jgi:4-diphosphocytidyl-2-C-methyl-D-erythritol kinase